MVWSQSYCLLDSVTLAKGLNFFHFSICTGEDTLHVKRGIVDYIIQTTWSFCLENRNSSSAQCFCLGKDSVSPESWGCSFLPASPLQFSDGAFLGVTTLKHVHLENNRLNQLPANFPFDNLETLTLTNNPWKCTCQLRGLRR